MKRCLVFIVLSVLLCGSAHADAIDVATGSTSYGIKFDGMVQSVLISPHVADISVETYIGTTAQDSFLVRAGSGYVVLSPCDSIYLIRPYATGVTVNPAYSNTAKLSMSPSPMDEFPYTKGAYASSEDNATIGFGFFTEHALYGYWHYTYVLVGSDATGIATVQWLLGGTVLRELPFTAGGGIADYLACDSIYISKTVATDSVFVGGYYPR